MLIVTLAYTYFTSPTSALSRTGAKNDCGPQALVALLQDYRIKADPDSIARLAGTDDDGTTMLGLKKAAESYSLTLEGMRLSMSALTDRLENGHGVIAFINGDHYVHIKAKGFPEIATEDLAFSAKARALEWRGVYADDVVCLEDYPCDYGRLRVRTEKWIRGTSEFLLRYFPAFARSRKVPWHEKVDLLINATSHYQTTAMLFFLLSIGALLPAYFSHFRYPGSFFLLPVPGDKSIIEYVAQIRYHIFWSWDFYLAMHATIVIPFLPAAIDLRRTPVLLIRNVIATQFFFLASIIADARAVAAFLITRQADFRNTNDASGSFRHGGMALVEFFSGGAFLILTFTSGNLWLLAPAIALITSPIVLRSGWDRRFIRIVTAIPCITGLIILAVITFQMCVSNAIPVSVDGAKLLPFVGK